MYTANDTGFRSFLVGAGGVTARTRVKLSSGAIVTAGAGEDSIGVVMETAAAGAYAAVKLWSAPGTFCIVADAAVALGAAVYGAADGEVDDTVAGDKLGIALESATAAGQPIEILPAAAADLIARQDAIADPAACADMTFAAGTIDTGTDMTAAEAGAIVADLAATKTAIDANNAAIDSILAALKANGIVATS